MALNVGELFSKLSLDDKEFDKGLSKGESKFSGFGKKLATMGAAAGAAAAAAIVAAVAEGIGQDAGVDKAAARLGLSEEESARLGKIAGAVYSANFGESVEANSQVVADIWKRFGDVGDKELQKLTEGAITLADVFDVDVNEVLHGAQQLFENGIAKSGTEAMDMVALALQKTKGPTDEVLAALNEYTNHFAQLGLDGPSVLGALAGEWSTNMYAIDKAGDAIKELGIRLIDGSETSKDALKEIGFSVSDVEAALAEGGQTAKFMSKDIISSILAIEDPAKRAQVGVALMGAPFEDLGNNAPGILGDIVRGVEEWGGTVEAVSDQAYDNVSNRMSGAWRTLKQSVVDNVSKVALPILEKAADFVSDYLPAAVEKFGEVWQAVVDFVGPLIERIGGMFGGLTRQGEGMSSRFSAIWEALKSAFSKGAEIVSAVVGTLTAWLAENQGTIQDIFGKIRTVVEKALEAVRVAVETVVGVISWIWENFGETILSVLTNVWDTIVGVFQAALDILGGIIDTFIGVFTGDWKRAWEGVKNIFGGIWDAIKRIIGGAVENVKIIVSGLFTKLGEWFGDLPGKIVGWLGDAGKWLVEKGRNIVEGLWEGIKSAAAWIKQKVIDFVLNIIPGPIANILGIHSPSRLMEDMMKAVPQGMVRGMEWGTRDVARAAENLAAASTPNVDRLASMVGSGGGVSFGDIQVAGTSASARDIADEIMWQAGVKMAGAH